MQPMNSQNHSAIPLGKADLHIHTLHSDGRPSVQEVLDHVAERTALRVIAITDHDTLAGALIAQDLQRHYSFDIVLGEEVTSRDGHILALFIKDRVPPGLPAAETIAAIHEQGGLAIAAHPFIVVWRGPVQGVGARFSDLPFDAVEVENSTPFMYVPNHRARHHNRRVSQMPEVGNSDAHIVEAIGKSYTRFAGYTALDLRHAIERNETSAHATPYASGDLLKYLRFWLESLGPAGPAQAGSE
jgi:predicted metal-dependent phosphoesterase TrpH